MRVIKFEAGLKPVFKHAEHDQSSHGNWAGTGIMFGPELKLADIVSIAKRSGLSRQTITRGEASRIPGMRNPSTINEGDLSFSRYQNGSVSIKAKTDIARASLPTLMQDILDAGYAVAQIPSGLEVRAFHSKSLYAPMFQIPTKNLSGDIQVEKHAEHDQSSHGNWANLSVDGKIVEGTTITGLINKLSEKKTPGFSIDIRTKQSPKDGFIASDKGAERVLDWEPLRTSRASLRKAIKDYVSDHVELLDNRGSFFGAWVEQGKLYLDVSRRYSSRSEGVRAGFRNEQKAIYDVVNDSYIYMEDEVDDRTNKASVGGNSQASQGNDGAGEGRLRGRNLANDRGQSVISPYVRLGGHQVEKHAEHDQSTHGNWATGGVVTSNEDAYAMQLDYIKKLGISANTGTLISSLKNSVSERIERRMSDISTEDLAIAAGIAFDGDRLIMGNAENNAWRTRTALTPSETHPDSFAYVWNYDGSIEFARSFTEIPAEYRDKAAQRGTPEAETLVREVAVSKLVGYWATTSNDNNYISLSIQKAAAEVFNIDDYAPWNDNVEPTATEMKVYKAFVSAQYDETQKMLKEQGVQAVELWRGMAANLDHTDKTSVERTMQMRPLSSWSSFKDIAYEFATERYTGGPQVPVVMRAVIPAEKILATPVTGVGCWGEREFVVLGGPVKTDAWNADVTRDFTVTSAVNKAVTPVIVENSDEIADWIKWRTWDLPTDPKLYSDEELVQLMKLPVWNAAPPAIRDAARLRLPMQKQALEPHVCLGRANIIQKHQAGLHDQATHGNWAGDRYPADSVPTARDGALEYAFKVGLKYDKSIDYTKVKADRERAARIADLYEKLPSSDPEAFDEYDALKSEIDEQFKYMTENLGVKVEFTDDDPYPNSKAMFDDVSQGTLKVLKTTSTSPHPYLTNDENDKFRAVHDYFGHAATGRGFGQDGEEAAWVHHSQMFTMKARGALTTETRGQNSFFNNRGKTFAEQKVALLPEEFWRVPAFAKALRIAFAAGLKPILKHLPGQHDQATHGSWAGYSAEESARIEALKDVGPSAADMVRIITGSSDSMVTTEELFDFVSNNEAYIKDAYEIYEGEFDVSLDEMTDEQKEEAIARYVDYERTSLEVIYQENNPSQSQTEASQMVPFFSEVYDISYTGTNRAGEEVNLYAETQDVYKDGENLKVEGNIYDRATGDKVGAFERRFFVKDGQLNVEHQYFEIYRDELKGTGFGKEFIQRSEDWYVSRGMGHILVGTAWEGARHWARAGYDFHPPTIMQNIGQLFEKVSWSEDFAEGTPARNDFDNLMRRMVTNYRYTGSDYPEFDNVQDMRNLDFPTPNDFAMIGYEPNRTYWEGRALMQDNHMTYMKVLTAEGRSILAGPIDRDGDGLVYDGTARERPAAADMPQGSVG